MHVATAPLRVPDNEKLNGVGHACFFFCLVPQTVVVSHNNQVRVHRRGSSHSGADEYPRGKKHKPKVVQAYITADAIHAYARNIQKVKWESATSTTHP